MQIRAWINSDLGKADMIWSRGVSLLKRPAVVPYLRKGLLIVGLHTICPAAWPLLEILALLGHHGPVSYRGMVGAPLPTSPPPVALVQPQKWACMI